MIGTQMSGFQDIYEVTENLGEPSLNFLNKMLFLICNCYKVSFLLHLLLLQQTVVIFGIICTTQT